MKKIDKHIRILRKKQWLSQLQLDHCSGVKREYIFRIEQGNLQDSTIDTLSKIAYGLEIPPESLLNFESASYSLQDLLQKSTKIEKKIDLLKDDLHKLTHLLDLMEKEPSVPQ